VIWFTVELSDKPGSLARMAGALGDRGVNISAIVGIAEDTGGALMLAFEEHDADAGIALDDHPRVAQGLADRGFGVG
jgi:hypothetical protein